MKGTSPALAPAGVVSPFQATFAATGIVPAFSAYEYDCTILIALAAVKAGSDQPARMRKAFAANLHGDTDCSTFAACRTLLDQGETIHWRGASSSFDAFGATEPGTGVFDVWSYDAAGAPVTAPPDQQIAIGP